MVSEVVFFWALGSCLRGLRAFLYFSQDWAVGLRCFGHAGFHLVPFLLQRSEKHVQKTH